MSLEPSTSLATSASRAKTAFPAAHASPERIKSHLHALAEKIGVRLAGSDGERAAAAYVAEQGEAFGAEVRQESFPVNQRDVRAEKIEIQIDGQWTPFRCSLFSSTPGTGGTPITAPLLFFEAPAEYRRPDLDHLRGRAVVHLGTHIESREHYRRLIEARPAFLLFVDIRYPGSVPLADGMFPEYARAIGAVPTVNVAYQDAWSWRNLGADAARLTVDGGMTPSQSSNVVLDLPGDTDELIYVGAHHDTQADSVGADDNGSGVAALLELGRLLAPLPRRRGIRLISFGAEEQLSVGSAHYVRRHRDEIARRGRLMWNFDSIGSPLGWTELIANGNQAMAEWAVAKFAECGLWVVPRPLVIPYADHFPFVVAGVPSAFLYRPNCYAGRFFHHRPDDDLTRVSTKVVAQFTDASLQIVASLATASQIPFPPLVEPELAAQADVIWGDLFGGWATPG